jgi:crotonobetainyl-CoA:carnitine CoA-transferase CaiB-like acyl-CoA transferase
MMAAQAITAALLGRERTGVGSHVELTMVDVALHFLWPDGMMNHTCLDDVDVLPDLGAGFRLSETLDGHVAMITVTDRQWRGLVAAVDLEAELDAPDLRTLQDRMRNGGRVMRKVGAALRALSTDDVVDRLHRHDVPCGPVVALDRLAEHPQIATMGALDRVEHPTLGTIVQPRPSAGFGERVEVGDLRPAPEVGEHTDEVLAAAGVDGVELAELRDRGVVV